MFFTGAITLVDRPHSQQPALVIIVAYYVYISMAYFALFSLLVLLFRPALCCIFLWSVCLIPVCVSIGFVVSDLFLYL